jgi:hypothetical protein
MAWAGEAGMRSQLCAGAYAGVWGVGCAVRRLAWGSAPGAHPDRSISIDFATSISIYSRRGIAAAVVVVIIIIIFNKSLGKRKRARVKKTIRPRAARAVRKLARA